MLSVGVFVVAEMGKRPKSCWCFSVHLLCRGLTQLGCPWDPWAVTGPGRCDRVSARRDWWEAVLGKLVLEELEKGVAADGSGASQQANPVAGSGVLSAPARSENSTR